MTPDSKLPRTGRAAYNAGQLGGKRFGPSMLTFERGAEAQVEYSLQDGFAGP